MEPELGAVLSRRERVLELVAVAVDGCCRHDLFERRIRDPPDSDERIANLLLLLGDLSLVGEILEAATSADAEVPARSIDPRWTGLEDDLGGRLGEAALRLGHLRAYTIAGQSAPHEDDEAVVSSNSVATVRERLDRELELLTFVYRRRHVARVRQATSCRAIRT